MPYHQEPFPNATGLSAAQQQVSSDPPRLDRNTGRPDGPVTLTAERVGHPLCSTAIPLFIEPAFEHMRQIAQVKVAYQVDPPQSSLTTNADEKICPLLRAGKGGGLERWQDGLYQTWKPTDKAIEMQCYRAVVKGRKAVIYNVLLSRSPFPNAQCTPVACVRQD